ncbi:hypothetical protein Vretimale_9418 [Volvox reticuliferus]|nr:hypothetical protein Vretifemale_9865 [Volvox reticuliferus]GIM04977.1 hypothetical protein Vretimale_9418 [Volvox reticuliferus]
MTYCNKSILDASGLKDERFLSLSSAARELLLAMMADDPRVRPTCMEVLRHPFITAVDSNAEAHREIEESVRRRMRDLAQLRRIHGLRYALQLQKPHGADHMEFLQALEQRRLKLKGDNGVFGRASENFARPSCADGGGGGGGFSRNSTTTDAAAVDGGVGGVPAFGRCSLAVSYSIPPPVLMARDRTTAASAPAAAAAAAAANHVTTAEKTATTAAASCTTSSPNAATAALASTLGFGGGGSRSAHGGRQHKPPSLQPIAEPSLASELSPPLLLMAAATAAPAGNAAAAVQGITLMDKCSEANSPDAQSRDEGVPVSDSLAARQRPGSGGRGLAVASVPTEPGGVATGSCRNQVLIDTMAIVNALPALQRCASANALTMAALTATMPLGPGDCEGAEARQPDGGSPVATAALVEQARMIRCMSANSETLELLSHQRSLKKMLEQIAIPAIPHIRD